LRGVSGAIALLGALSHRSASVALPLGTAWLLSTSYAVAASSDNAREAGEASIASVEAQIGSVRKVNAQLRSINPEKLVAAAQLHLATKDYDSAIDQLNKVVELAAQGKASEATEADARFLLAQAYFSSGQLYSARREYGVITDRASRPAYATFAGRSASRLVDVALRTKRLEDLDVISSKLSGLAASDPSGSLQYARAKTQLARGDLAGARSNANAVPVGAEFYHRSLYLLGVVEAKAARAAAKPDAKGESHPDYAAAIAVFTKAATTPASSPEQQRVVDLSWMAIGRLEYEVGDYLQAAQAYTKVPRTSPEFSTALYELGWSYVRLEDFTRAQSALELLSVLDPGHTDGADAALLRADLLLRAGKFQKAYVAYQQARSEYDPLQRQVAAYLEKHAEPADYYDALTADEIEVSGELPQLAVEWAREQAQEERAFDVIDEVSRSRQLVKRSDQLIVQLRAVLASASRSKMFPELEGELKHALRLLNQVGTSRRTLAVGLDDEAGTVSGELEQVRAERRKLMARVAQLPSTPAEMQRRDSETERSWKGVSQKLQQLTLEADYLQAMVNGLRRVLVDAQKFEVTRDPAARARFEAEIQSNEAELVAHRQRIETLRQSVEIGKMQVGLGDERYTEDDQVRRKFRELLGREVALVAAGGDSSADAVEYARAIQPLLARADRAEDMLDRSRRDLDASAEATARDVSAIVEREAQSMAQYAAQLEELDQSSRVLVGEVAMKSLEKVRERLKSVVLRADVGIVQHAWEIREEQMSRVRDLQRERAREERFLNDELREVLDDAEDSQ
jgi:tetratricopeptide (TPR) repeat protein